MMFLSRHRLRLFFQLMSVRVFLDNIGRDYFLADIVQSVFGRHQSKLFFADVYRDYFLVDVKQDYFFVDIG